MKKLVVLVLIGVFVFAFAFSAVSQGPPERCTEVQCYDDQGCAYDPDTGLYYCWWYKCCRDQYLYKGKCYWNDYVCVSKI